MLLVPLAKKFNVDPAYIIKQTSILLNNQELKYISKTGFMIADAGLVSATNKKYFIEAEDLLWKKRERIFNFVTKPVVFLIAIFTFTIALYNLYKANVKPEYAVKMEQTISTLQARLFQLENDMEATKNR